MDSTTVKLRFLKSYQCLSRPPLLSAALWGWRRCGQTRAVVRGCSNPAGDEIKLLGVDGNRGCLQQEKCVDEEIKRVLLRVKRLEEFLSKIAAQLEATEHLYKNYENMGRTDSPETEDLELLQADASFSQLLSNISLLYNQSIMLVKRKEQVFGDSFLAAFTTESRPSLVSAMQSPGFFTTLGFDQILGSVSDFGKNVLEELSSTVANVFEEIKEAEVYFQQPSTEQKPLQTSPQAGIRVLATPTFVRDCPSVQQLHSEVEEMHSLLNASQQEYDTLQLVQRHTADTQRCLSNMQDRLCWVSQLSNSTTGPQHLQCDHSTLVEV
ncbi:hypothetical protein F7725_028922 [Dissostichus mawsoni]|uniref:Uncharacterized protein n=1 Tax=Dissostichus mawsoni TaxID=36200 RepID=A0A7J5XH60_DISMA|nr:hypothetical protein F7725_028922 [Dissostichus mawsoni]